jgi:streptogramin lyase
MVSPSAMAADVAGGIWLLDRRGGKVARLDPAGSEPEVIWEDRQRRLGDLVWDGRRAVGVDLRGGGLVAIAASGAADAFADVTFSKPLGLAVDLAGQVAVLDGRTSEVVLVGPGGRQRARLPLASAGLERPTALALGADGSLDVFDEASASVVRIP